VHTYHLHEDVKRNGEFSVIANQDRKKAQKSVIRFLRTKEDKGELND